MNIVTTFYPQFKHSKLSLNVSKTVTELSYVRSAKTNKIAQNIN